MDGRIERGDRTSEAIFIAAKKAFARKGFAGASVRDIGKAAKLNPALLRYHYGSKGDLYAFVVDTVMTELRKRLLASLQGASDPADMIKRVLDAYLDYLDEEQDFPRIVQRSLLDNDDHAVKHVKKHIAPMLQDAAHALKLVGPKVQRNLVDSAMTLFSASLAPHIYAPLVSGLTGEDPRTPKAAARRKEHLEVLVQFMLSRLSA